MTPSTFGGTYCRRLLPEGKVYRVRRLCCLKCGCTHSVLPACVFGRVHYPEQTLAPYLQHKAGSAAAIWQNRVSDGPKDVTTLYRWLRRLKARLQTLIPLLQQTLLELAPDTNLETYQTTVLKSTSPPGTMALCQPGWWLTQQLLAVTAQLKQQPCGLSELAFLNYFSWQRTGQSLLAPVANAPPPNSASKPT